FLWRNNLFLPDVLTQNEQHVLGFKEKSQVEIGAYSVQVKPLDTWIKVDQTDGDASHAHNRHLCFSAFRHHKHVLIQVEIERIGENIDRIKADFFGLVNSESRSSPCLHPGRVDQAELHDEFSIGVAAGLAAACVDRRFRSGSGSRGSRTMKQLPSP